MERVDVEGVAVEVVEVINRVCLCGLSTETLCIVVAGAVTYEYFVIVFEASVVLVEDYVTPLNGVLQVNVNPWTNGA